MTTRWLSRIAGAALALATFTGAAEAQRIEVMGVGNPQTHALFEQLVAGFREKVPGSTVTYRTGAREGGEGLQALLRTKLVGGALPDVFLYSGNFTRALVDAELVVDVDALIAADPTYTPAAFSPSVRASGVVRDRSYGLGFGISLPVVLFNSELVRKAGGNPDALPADWAGIVDLARKMDGVERGVVGGAIEYDNGGAFSWLFLLQSHGGRMMDETERRLAFAGPEGRAAVDLLRRFGEVGQAKSDMTRDQLRQAFGAGTVGVLVGMSSLITRYETQAAGKFRVLARPFPLAAAGGTIPTAGPIGVILTRDPARQRLAWEFLKFTAGVDGQILIAEEGGYAPMNKAAIDASERLRAIYAARPNAPSYIERLDVATGWYAPPGENSVKIGNVINDHLQQAVTLRQTPDAVVRAMAQDVEKLLGN